MLFDAGKSTFSILGHLMGCHDDLAGFAGYTRSVGGICSFLALPENLDYNHDSTEQVVVRNYEIRAFHQRSEYSVLLNPIRKGQPYGLTMEKKTN